jgi:ribonuclease HII
MTVGVDEVGRGCWAGPLVAGAVILDKPIPGLADSKKLTRLQRQRLNIEIRLKAKAFGLGWVTPQELDKIGLTEAVRLAMQRAVAEIKQPFDEIIVDGNYNYLSDHTGSTCLVKADDSVPAVSAASILAKVARDTFMYEVAQVYPAYQFEKHVGYGTAAHIQALQEHGICDLHRKSFAPVRALLTAL